MLALKWLPTHDSGDDEVLAKALVIETEHWKHMSIAITNGIVKAFKG